jgi:hypothetical protein
MVICPAYTESEILPDHQMPVTVTYRDEWMDEFFKELENHKPPQRLVHFIWFYNLQVSVYRKESEME